MEVSPDGTSMFVTGQSSGSATSNEWATLAYEASTGTVRWKKRFNGLTDAVDRPSSVAVSPDSAAVFVTGYADLANGMTIAYAA
jgi:DNA-binding beta-propeller fold protein YncE